MKDKNQRQEQRTVLHPRQSTTIDFLNQGDNSSSSEKAVFLVIKRAKSQTSKNTPNGLSWLLAATYED